MNKLGILLKTVASMQHIFCTDHVLQLTAKVAFTDQCQDVETLKKLCALVRYFNKSPQPNE
jgi:hypothetical protein